MTNYINQIGMTGNFPLTVGQGGTLNTTFTAYSVLCGGTTATGAFQNVSGVGSSGNVLTSNGASALPTWQAPATSGTVTSVGTGTGLRGGAITSSGTVNLATQLAMSHRLTLTTATPVTTSDVTAATTLYLTPYKGTDIDIYSGSVWVRFQQAELSITNATLSASTPYDVFIQYNSGTPQLSLTAWTNGTTRATGLAYQNGILVLSGTTTSRYLGTVYMDGSSKFNDAVTNRTVWNYYNRIARKLVRIETTSSWTYGTNTFQQANASSANQVNAVIGVVEDILNLNLQVSLAAGATYYVTVGVGINSTTVNSATSNQVLSALTTPSGISATFSGLPPLGYSYFAWLEAASSTVTFYGQTTFSGSIISNSGLSGYVWG